MRSIRKRSKEALDFYHSGKAIVAQYWREMMLRDSGTLLSSRRMECEVLAEAVEKIDEIASVPGITACYIGPVDLALSMGSKDMMKDMAPGTKHDKAMKHVVGLCKSKGVAAGCFCFNAEHTNFRIDQGFTFVNCLADDGLMIDASQAAFNALKL
jgi:2-keto-3-deoxy-L-rhamnonate aldolase RhmA